MICKDEDVCYDCFLRRKGKDCGYEPYGDGPDIDGEYSLGCEGHVGETDINNSYFNDCLSDYHGIGDPIPWDLLYPIMLWSGMNWLEAALS